jgi:cellulose synthase/poly-beta-1,6-N-acetylglucosamine synthase-like glycosyltransferase
LSAVKTFSFRQKLYLILLPLFIAGGFFFWPLKTAQILVSVLSILYFIDTIFFFFLVLRSLQRPEELRVSQKELKTLYEHSLPIYTILCPLYKEAHVVPQFVEAISKLDWPKDKLDVMLLLEEDDQDTVATIKAMALPEFVRIVVVPHSMPKTKPKACNYGLAFAKGEYLVIYDAEDIPDPLQLKKAYIGFQKAPENVQCLQAKLNYYNSHQNVLTRFFTAEYSLWFDLTLTGLQSLNSALPLGGTSNHFKTKILRELQGWDPFNVTEDADLGIRLFQKGYRTAIIDSTTLEEATSVMKNWLRQRSRWIKGYMQTYLVHMRNFINLLNDSGRKTIIYSSQSSYVGYNYSLFRDIPEIWINN